jgi:Protein of unknown function (DUF2817)
MSTFAASYQEARQKFLSAASSAGLAVQSHAHPLPGLDGEPLAMDVVRQGPHDAAHVLILSSACHGVEGYCGSGVQVSALQDAAWHKAVQGSGVAVVYIHALNPHGFSFKRRVTHENVDLNRNFQDFSQTLPANPAYADLHPLLLPDVWPPDPANVQAVTGFIAEHGMGTFQGIVSRGQHSHPDGLFFGGQAPTWSNQTLRQVLREHAGRAQHLAWIDFHTGLGPCGHGERIFACKDDAEALARARNWWGQEVTSIYDGSSSSAFLTGLMWMAAYQECPQAQYTGIAMEYGTQPPEAVIMALRGDHWLHLHPEASSEQRSQIRQAMMDAFYGDSDDWRARILEQGMDSMHQALDGLLRS